MNYSRVLSDHRFLHTSPGFSAQALLERINSPRLADMPELANWIEAAADDAGVSRELMCVVPQKEQSGLTAPTIRPFGLRAFCGYGVTRPGEEPRPEWSGPEKQLRAAAKRLRQLIESATSAEINNWIARVGESFGPVGITPHNAATAALYSYTPSKPDKANILAIWRTFGFGDPLAETQEPTDMRQRFVDLVTRLADEGDHWYVWGAQGPEHFDCSGLVMWCGSQVGLWPASHDTTADGLWDGVGGGERIDKPSLRPGDLVLYGPAANRATHVEVWVGPSTQTIGANGGRSTTTSVARARGINAKVKRSTYTRRRDLLGFVRLPFRADAEPDLAVVAPDGEPIDCSPRWDGEQVVCLARPLIEALGHEAHYRVRDDGRQRVYIKRQESGVSSQESE